MNTFRRKYLSEQRDSLVKHANEFIEILNNLKYYFNEKNIYFFVPEIDLNQLNFKSLFVNISEILNNLKQKLIESLESKPRRVDVESELISYLRIHLRSLQFLLNDLIKEAELNHYRVENKDEILKSLEQINEILQTIISRSENQIEQNAEVKRFAMEFNDLFHELNSLLGLKGFYFSTSSIELNNLDYASLSEQLARIMNEFKECFRESTRRFVTNSYRGEIEHLNEYKYKLARLEELSYSFYSTANSQDVDINRSTVIDPLNEVKDRLNRAIYNCESMIDAM